MLIHDALCDYIMCGDTSVLAHEFRAAVCAMQKMDAKGQSGFMRQFEVCVYINIAKFAIFTSRRICTHTLCIL